MSVKKAFLKLKPEDGDIIFLDVHVVDMLLGKDVKYEDGKIIIFTGEQHGVSTDCKRTEPGKAGEGTGTGSHPASAADLRKATGEGNVGGGSG